MSSGVLTSMEVHQLTERLGEEVENAMTTAKATVLSDLLSRYLFKRKNYSIFIF